MITLPNGFTVTEERKILTREMKRPGRTERSCWTRRWRNAATSGGCSLQGSPADLALRIFSAHLFLPVRRCLRRVGHCRVMGRESFSLLPVEKPVAHGMELAADIVPVM